ncbi:hypothetical protein ACPZ19_33715 [Amycolatopsis lurida]
MCCPSASLAVWSSAWLHGAAASDDALDALRVWGEDHEVVAADPFGADAFDIPVAGERPAGLAGFLTGLRRLGAGPARFVLPVPGDVRGLGGGGSLTEAALRSGEAVVFAEIGYGVVPEVIAEGLYRWTVHRITTAAPMEYIALGEAEHALTSATRSSAGALQELDVARDRPGVRAELSERLRRTAHVSWPPGTPGRALRVLQRAEEIGAILAIAHADDPGGALSASAAIRRADALRPLHDAVRTARFAAVNETIRVFADQPDPLP